MATIRQIEANRRNSQKSTGPRSVEGKAVSRFNALKTGIDAHSHAIPGEDIDALEALTLEYHDRFRPAAPERRFLVDALVTAEWQLRRLRKTEGQLWEHVMQDAWRPKEDLPVGQAFELGGPSFNRLQRRIDSAERSYYRALEEIQRLPETASQSPQPDQATTPQPYRETEPLLLPAAEPEVQQNQKPHPQIGFVPPPAARGALYSEKAVPAARRASGAQSAGAFRLSPS